MASSTRSNLGVTITKACWSSENNTWTLAAYNEQTQEPLEFSCNFLVPCTGYYNYDTGFMPKYPGAEQFKGELFHPQHWPEKFRLQRQKCCGDRQWRYGGNGGACHDRQS